MLLPCYFNVTNVLLLHTYIHSCMYVYMWYMYMYVRALSDFDGDYAPEIGTEDPLRTSCRRTSSEIQLP